MEIAKERLETAKLMQGRNEFGPVIAVAERLVGEAGIELPDDSPSWEYLHRMLMRAFVELHEAAAAHLSGNVDYRPKDTAMVVVSAVPEPEAGKSDERTIEQLIAAYETDKGKRWSGSTKKAVVPVFRLLRDVFPGRAVTSITREDARGVLSLLEGLPANMGKRKDLAGLTVPQAVEKGKPIAGWFRQGRGLVLQSIDSDIVDRVTGYLIHRGICCLPVHDSFIVPRSAEFVLGHAASRLAPCATFMARCRAGRTGGAGGGRHPPR